MYASVPRSVYWEGCIYRVVYPGWCIGWYIAWYTLLLAQYASLLARYASHTLPYFRGTPVPPPWYTCYTLGIPLLVPTVHPGYTTVGAHCTPWVYHCWCTVCAERSPFSLGKRGITRRVLTSFFGRNRDKGHLSSIPDFLSVSHRFCQFRPGLP